MIPISNIIVAKSAHKMCTFCYIMCTFVQTVYLRRQILLAGQKIS